MFKHIKRGILFILGILFIPMVKAQVRESLSASGGVLEETFKGVFDILGGILLGVFGGFYELVQRDPLFGKILISIVIGIILYDRLKDIEALKERAGIIAAVIALITFVGLPSDLVSNIFRNDSSGIVFVVGIIVAGVILAIAKGDSNWAHFGRFVSYLMLTIGLAGVTAFSGGNSVLQVGASLLTAGCAIAAFWNLIKLKWIKDLKEEFGSIKESVVGDGGSDEDKPEKPKKPKKSKEKEDEEESEEEEEKEDEEEEKKKKGKLDSLGTAFSNLDKFRKVIDHLGKVSALLNTNLCIKNPTKDNLDHAKEVIVGIEKTFTKENIEFLNRFGDKELNGHIKALTGLLSDYMDYLNSLDGKDTKEIRAKLGKDKSDLKNMGIITKNILAKHMIKRIEFLQARIVDEIKEIKSK